MNKKRLVLGGLTVVGMMVVGCGNQEDLPRVYGVVTLDGVPVPNANVSFYPAQGRASLGVTNDDGYYEIKYSSETRGAEKGNYRVTISTAAPSKPTKGIDAVSAPAVPESLPEIYSSLTESVLTAHVTDSKNQIDFALKKTRVRHSGRRSKER